MYLQPSGWVTVTDQYDGTKPREFPVANNELEIFSPDDVLTQPRPRAAAESSGAGTGDLLQFRNLQVVTSSTE